MEQPEIAEAKEEEPELAGVDVAAEEAKNDSVRSCYLSAKQLYERFEKLPLETRKHLAQWAVGCCDEASPLIVMPKAGDNNQGECSRQRFFCLFFFFLFGFS
jgi:hypothetical protein